MRIKSVFLTVIACLSFSGCTSRPEHPGGEGLAQFHGIYEVRVEEFFDKYARDMVKKRLQTMGIDKTEENIQANLQSLMSTVPDDRYLILDDALMVRSTSLYTMTYSYAEVVQEGQAFMIDGIYFYGGEQHGKEIRIVPDAYGVVVIFDEIYTYPLARTHEIHGYTQRGME